MSLSSCKDSGFKESSFTQGSNTTSTLSSLVKKYKKSNECSSLKKLSTNLTPSESGNKKKKRFSSQKCFSFATKSKLTLVDLPLLPLSYVCKHLSLAEREMFSQVCPKFAAANKMSWLRRAVLNVQSDIASYVFEFDDDNDTYDNAFEFVSLNLLWDKVQLISSYFTGPRFHSVDFSSPKEAAQTNKYGDILLVNRQSFSQSMEMVRQNISELNFCNALVSKDVLKECSRVFPHLSLISLSLHLLIWRSSSNSNPRTNGEKVVKNWKRLTNQIQPIVAEELLPFLHRRFPRLNKVNLYN